jgi:TM2 domain-containing membrane protein YozV
VAVVLSALVPGIGQIYLGEILRGIIWLVGLVIVAVIVSQGTVEGWVSPVMAGLLSAAAALDAAVIWRLRSA